MMSPLESMHSRGRASATLVKWTVCASLCCLASERSTAQTITTLVIEGDAIAGVGNVDQVLFVDVDSAGSWIAAVDTDFPLTGSDDVVLRDGVQILRLNDPLPEPAGASLGTFGIFDLADNGDFAATLSLNNLTAFTNRGVFRGTDLVIQKGDLAAVPSLDPATAFTDFSNAAMLGPNGRVLCITTFDDPLINSLVDHAVMVFTLVSPGTTMQLVVAQEGDVLAGQTESVVDFGNGEHQLAQNAVGDVAYIVDLTGNVLFDSAIYLNDSLVVQEGAASELEPGSTWGPFASSGIDVNRFGQVAFRGSIAPGGGPGLWNVVVLDGALIARQFDPVPGVPGESFTNFGTLTPVQCSDNGDVAYFADFSGPTTTDNGIFVNHELLVREGVTTINGLLVEQLWSDSRSFRMSDNGRYLAFRAVLAGGLDGAFMIDRGPRPEQTCVGDGTFDAGSGPIACPCSNESAIGSGEGCSNSQGHGAHLVATGSLSVASADTVFTADRARANQPGMLLQGASFQALPFKDGILCMGNPTERVEVAFTDASGHAQTMSDVAAGGHVAPGDIRYYQFWYRDPALSPCGAGSNFTQGVRVLWH